MAEPDVSRSEANLWELRVDTRTGVPVSNSRQITNWAEALLPGISGTSDGKQLAITKQSAQTHVYVGELEAGGRRLMNPRRLTLEESIDYPSTWMPDSKAVVFWSNRYDRWGIYKQGLDQTTAETIVTGPDNKYWPVVSPDGSWILYLSYPASHHLSSTVRAGLQAFYSLFLSRSQPLNDASRLHPIERLTILDYVFPAQRFAVSSVCWNQKCVANNLT